MFDRRSKKYRNMKGINWILIGLLGSVFIGGCLQEKVSLDEIVHNETLSNYSTPTFEINRSEDGRLIIPGEELNETRFIPDISSFVLSSGPLAYRRISTSVTLLIRTGSLGVSIPNETEIFLDYKVDMLHPDGTLESEPEGVEIIPKQKRFVFPGKVEGWEINPLVIG